MEKRRGARCAMDDEVTLSTDGTNNYTAQVMDVSAEGIRIRFDEDLKPGTPVFLSLDFLKEDLPDHTMTVPGEVMHRFMEPGGVTWQVGLRLRFEDDKQERTLLTHLSSCRSTF